MQRDCWLHSPLLCEHVGILAGTLTGATGGFAACPDIGRGKAPVVTQLGNSALAHILVHTRREPHCSVSMLMYLKL